MAAAVSASSSAMFFSDPSWLKSLRGSQKATRANVQPLLPVLHQPFQPCLDLNFP
jgi:hypothetical protein